jgi:hypothetical protein
MAEGIKIGRSANPGADGLLERGQVVQESLLGIAGYSGLLDPFGVASSPLRCLLGSFQLSGQF